MKDIPQPSNSPYSVGERVQVYVDSADHESRFHGDVCEIVSVREDNLDQETGRSTDQYRYSLRDTDTGDSLPPTFRHFDLVPAEDDT